MKILTSKSALWRLAGFTLIEAVVSTLVISIVFLAGIGALNFSEVQMMRDRERSIMLDFGMHYIETLKGLPFDQISSGVPINSLYDGINSGSNIRLPSDANWYSLSNTNFQNFHPDLVLMVPRNPEYRINLITTQVGGVPWGKQVELDFRWDAPLGRGAKTTGRLDMARFKDL